VFSKVADGGKLLAASAWLGWMHIQTESTCRLLVGVTCTSAATSTCFCRDAASVNDRLCGSSCGGHILATKHACCRSLHIQM
jgi:hypothetical protein